MSVGFRNSTFPDLSPLLHLADAGEKGYRCESALDGPPAGAARLPHTKWAWRHTAKWVICEVGLCVNGEQKPAGGLIELIYAARMTSPNVGWRRCWIGFLSGLGWVESLTATNLSA